MPCEERAGYIFAVWAVVQKVAPANNQPICVSCMREIRHTIRKQN